MTTPEPPCWVADRRGTWSLKWDRWADRPGVLPLWVADMDVAAPPVVLAALRERLDHGVLGYTREPEALGAALAGWCARRHGWAVDPAAVMAFPGTMIAARLIARVLGRPGAPGIVLTPTYPPLRAVAGHAGQCAVEVPLVETAAGWRLDHAALERIDGPAGGILWLCSPHNPTGRIWDVAELAALAALARRLGLRVVADEVWADGALPGARRHRPFPAAAPDLAARTITLFSIGKSFNLPGLGLAAAVVPDPAERRALRAAAAELVPYPTAPALVAAVAAWSGADAWVDALAADIATRVDATLAGLRAAGLRVHRPEATPLLWIPLGERVAGDPARAALAAGVGLSEGDPFGAPGWVRLNAAADPALLAEAVARLARLVAG
ncbi:MAG: hypothetical protein RLZZ127_1430 [Planctomycetota bacterium]|jgi:cystathionine beta-lyase